jgi:hypothetical protein
MQERRFIDGEVGPREKAFYRARVRVSEDEGIANK